MEIRNEADTRLDFVSNIWTMRVCGEEKICGYQVHAPFDAWMRICKFDAEKKWNEKERKTETAQLLDYGHENEKKKKAERY
jgi:hypothetical protein